MVPWWDVYGPIVLVWCCGPLWCSGRTYGAIMVYGSWYGAVALVWSHGSIMAPLSLYGAVVLIWLHGRTNMVQLSHYGATGEESL